MAKTIHSTRLRKVVDNAIDVSSTQDVLICCPFEAGGGIDKQYIFRLAALLEHQNASRNAGAVEDVCRQADYAIKPVAIFDQVLPDVPLSSATEKARRAEGSPPSFRCHPDDEACAGQRQSRP